VERERSIGCPRGFGKSFHLYTEKNILVKTTKTESEHFSILAKLNGISDYNQKMDVITKNSV